MAVLAPRLKQEHPAALPARRGDPYDVAAVLPSILETAVALIAADAYAVWLQDASDQMWRPVAARGLSDEYLQQTLSAPKDSVSAGPIYAENMDSLPTSLESLREIYRREQIQALMAMPLCIRNESRGALVFYFRQLHKFTQSEIERASSLGKLAGSALATAELYHEQLRAKERSEFLAQATAVLTSSLDYEKTLAALTHLAVPHVADWCGVEILENGELKRLAVAHVDPDRVNLVREMAEKYPSPLNEERGLGRVLATGECVFYPELTDDLLQQGARSPEHLEMLRGLRMCSVLLVPLKARNQVLGVLTFAMAESGRQLEPADGEMATELAQRAAVALDNARLFTALKQSEQKFRAVSESAACAVYIFDGVRYLYANRAAEELIGYTLEEYGDADMWMLVHPADRELLKQRALAQIRGELGTVRQEVRVLRREGQTLWLDITSSPIEYAGRPALLATAFDITDRRITLDKLERRELEARTLLNNIPDYIARFDRELRYLYKSPHPELIAPMPPGQYIGKTFRDLGIPAEIAEVWENSLRHALETGEARNVEYSLASSAGAVRHYVSVVTPEVARDGTVQSVLTITRDVTEQRNAAELLRRSEAQLRLIIDSMPGLVAYVDNEKKFRRVNRTFEEWFKAPMQTFIGRTIREVLGEQNYEYLAPHVMRALRGEIVQYESTNEYRDTTRHVLITYVPDYDSQLQVCGFVALVMDVTDRRNAEEALRKTEKLAAAGRLAASIAHEINNPLESVTNLLFLLKREPALSEAGRQYLELAEDELARVTHIATQTLRFHRQSTRPMMTSIEEIIDAVEGLYQRRMASSGVALEKRYGGAARIYALDGELRQLLANLIGNALDATPPGGKIVVRTRDAVRNGTRGVRITIADNGHGIPAELLSRIFEPFVTTKGMTGTGLGLWVSREIIEKHQGYVRVRSRCEGPQTGSVFMVFIAELPQDRD